MAAFTPHVSTLINDFWQRYPARHDIRVFIDRCVVSIYVNSEALAAQLQRSYHDQLTIARPEILVAVIQDPGISPDLIVADPTSSFALTTADGRIDWVAKDRLLKLYNRGRYMIGGDCESVSGGVRGFVKAAVDDWSALGQRRLSRGDAKTH